MPLYNADIQAKGFPAEANALADAVRAADGVIVVTPEYNFTIPGGLKNAFDWLSRMKEQPFVNKPIAIQSASQGPVGGARMQYDFRKMMVYLDAVTLNKPEIFVGMAQTKFDEKTGELKDETTRQFRQAAARGVREIHREDEREIAAWLGCKSAAATVINPLNASVIFKTNINCTVDNGRAARWILQAEAYRDRSKPEHPTFAQ